MGVLQNYVDDIKRMGRDDFLRSFQCPVLLLAEDARGGAEFSSVTSMMVRPNAKGAQQLVVPRQTVLPLQKRSGAPFASQISLGRGRGTDVGLDNDSVSKFHAYFMVEADRTLLADAGSLNGTTVNGVTLTPRTLTAIDSGATLTFGEVRAAFYSAVGFYNFLKKQF